MSWYQFDNRFDIDFIWSRLLNEKTLPSSFSFPPEVLSNFGNTLEIQAAQMLIHACINNDKQVCISLSIADHPPLALQVLNDDDNEAVLLNLAKKLRAHCCISTLNSAEHTPSFDDPFELIDLESNSQQLLVHWFKVNIDSNDKDISGQLNKVYQNTPGKQPQLASHFINASVSKYEDVILDKGFSSSQASPQERLYTQLITAYCHIKSSLPLRTLDLDTLIDDCRDANETYWLAYLLCYGRIITENQDNSNYNSDFKKLTKAHLVFRSLGDLIGITRVFHTRATLHNKLGRTDSALRLMNVCLKIRIFLQEPLAAAKIYNGMAFIFSQDDRFNEALAAHKEAEHILIKYQQYEELAFTYSLISWIYFLIGQYTKAIENCEQTLNLMEKHSLHTLTFRTKPDIHAQLGLMLFQNGEMNAAIEHSNFCEAHKIDSTGSGELMRTLLRGLINDERDQPYLADISFNYMPSLLEEHSNVDIHIEALFYRYSIERIQDKSDEWKKESVKRKAITFCKAHKLNATINWFESN
jgi:tetratricopeptide (TPR) repeat protein